MSDPAASNSLLVLGSSSPRRRELLQQLGVPFHVIVAEVDEGVRPGEAPSEYVVRVARDKARAVGRQLSEPLPVLAADTAVVVDGAILGKPEGPADAASMLDRLSGRSHEVYSAVTLALPDGSLFDRLSVTKVTFADLDGPWIEAYIATGDPLDKAGAYGVQGRAAEKISRIEGTFSGVMGLPLFETGQLLRQAEVLS